MSVEAPGAEAIEVKAQVPATHADLSFEVLPDARRAPEADSGSAVNPRLASAMRAARRSATVSATCAVPRNDPHIQVYQPHWRHVERAVDQQMVLNRLKVVRSNWKGLGLPDWNPQTMFPAEELRGGGRVPTSIMLGALAQESNLWQAQGTVMEG